MMKIVVASGLLILCLALAGQVEEPLKYAVNVNVRIVPFFATDRDGLPVMDLRQEELDFYINGKKTELDYIIYRGLQAEIPERTVTESKPKPLQERIIFMILDFFNLNLRDEKRLKEIAREIVQTGRLEDRFVVVGILPGKGLEQITDLEPLGPGLLKAIDSLTRRRISGSGIRPYVGPGGPGDITDPELSGSIAGWVGRPYTSEGWGSEHARSMQYFKYAMKIFIQPKVVYFISQGFPLYGENQFHLTRIVQAFREGGASVFTINPAQFTSGNTRESLRAIAEETGGDYFEANQVKQIVENVRRTGSAYYEAVFNLSRVTPADEYVIHVQCRRPSVRILVPGAITEEKKYGQMPSFEKKLFAADIISSGLWSRMRIKVTKPVFSCENLNQGKEYRTRVTVAIPAEMQGLDADIFTFRMKKNEMDVKMKKSERKLQASEILDITGARNEKFFFVIIEHSGRLCLSAQVR